MRIESIRRVIKCAFNVAQPIGKSTKKASEIGKKRLALIGGSIHDVDGSPLLAADCHVGGASENARDERRE